MTHLITKFIKFISDNSLFTKKNRILLAISGGVDSVVLAMLLKEFGADFALAHCNFQLRGEESDGDEAFVIQLASELGVNFYVKHFNTEKIAAEKGISIQMAARELRYDWLFGLLENKNFDLLATAHHLNDSIETLIMNLAKGCGIRGLHGILPKNEEKRIVRPLLFASKDEIIEAALTAEIRYRVDSSNASIKYARNRIRHQMLPLLKKLNPALERSFETNFKHFWEAEQLFDFAIETIKKQILDDPERDEILKIDIEKLNEFPSQKTVIFEMLSPYGFNSHQVEQIFNNLQNLESAFFLSEDFILERSYGKLILKKKNNLKDKYCVLVEKLPLKDENIEIETEDKIFKLEINDSSEVKSDLNVAFFDAEKLQMPLCFRYKKDGDSFIPKGMGGKKKKISKFLKDIKMNISERDRLIFLDSSGKIIWIPGHRHSESYAVTELTNLILKVSIIKNKI